jgi:hypothetical protein
MADEVLSIKQGDTIYFYDTTIGNVASYSWNFNGGNPSTSINPNEYVTFIGTNPSGYSISLSVTSANGITVVITKSGIISVNAETISSAFTLNSNSRLMSQNLFVGTAGATASSGIANYSWIIPGLGSTSGVNLSSLSYTENNWYNISGTYSGAVNSSYLATSSLTITSNIPNTSTTNQNITYYKMGPSEEYDLAAIGPSGPYYDPYIYPYNSGSIGIGGSNLVIKISQPYPSSVFNNNSFHSTGEVFYFYPNNVDAYEPYTIIKLRIILNKIQLDALGAAYTTVNDEFINGSYMLPGGINDIFGGDIYLTDYTISGGSQLTILQDPLVRGWQNEDIIEYLRNTYYKSTSSKWIENLKTPRIAYDFLLGKKVSDTYDFKGGYSIAIKPGILVPSSSLIYSIVGEIAVVKIILAAYDMNNEVLANVEIILSENGDSGNSPDGMILTTNDTHEYTELGIVSIINNAINASSLAGNIILESSTSFSPYTLEYSTDFPGIRISLVDPVFSTSGIAYVKMDWSDDYISFITSFNSLEGLELPFCSTTGSSFTGLPDEIFSFSFGAGLQRGWTIGNQIA